MTVAQDGRDGEAARQLSDAHNQLLTDPSIQFELPPAGSSSRADPTAAPVPQSSPSAGPTGNAPPQPQSGPIVQADPSATPPEPTGSLDLPASGSEGFEGLMQVFLWVAAAAALAILLYWLFTFFRDRQAGGREARAPKTRGGKAEAWRPEEGQAVQLLDEADILANEGRFDEAARLLLHRSIGEIHAHRPDLVRPALTSRDIAGHPLLPAAPAVAFARIAALVERSLFARRPLGANDWQDCRAAYREFAFAEGWQR